MNKLKNINKISIIISILSIFFCIISKTLYYIDKIQLNFFNSMTIALLWSFTSITLSLLPILFSFVINVYVLIKKNSVKNFHIITMLLLALIYPTWALNIGVEFISILGSGMTLDESWMNMAFTMILYHLFTLIPIILTTIVTIMFNKQKQE